MAGDRDKDPFRGEFDFEALKDLMRCPKSKSELVRDGNSLVSADRECRLKYEIRDGIPSMFPDDAVVLSLEEWSAVMARTGRDVQTGESVSGGSSTGNR